MKRRIFLCIITVLLTFSATALEFTDFYKGLAEAFEPLMTDGEGNFAYKSLSIPMGGKAEGMAQAFTAVSDDVSFLDYNPAGSAIMQDRELAVFHNAWIADSALDALAYSMRLGNFGIGAGLRFFYVPFTEYNIFGQRTSGGYYSESAVTLNCSYTFFRGYDFRGLSVGANVKAAWRIVPDFSDKNSDLVVEGSGAAQSGFAFLVDVGVLARFNLFKHFSNREPNCSVGVTLQNVGFGFLGGRSASGVGEDALPTQILIGICYRPIQALAIALDFHQKLNFLDLTNSGSFYVGIGFDIGITDFLSMNAGFGLNGANPRFSLGVRAKIKMMEICGNYTLDLATSFNPFNHFSLSVKILLGDGGIRAHQAMVDSLYSEGLRQYGQNNLTDAIRCWKEVLRYEPRFDPAIRGIKAAETRLKERVDMENMEMPEDAT